MLPSIRERFADVGVADVRVTTAKGEERAVARRAVDAGYTTLVAVGGDGTWSNVAGAMLHAGSGGRLALVAAGTGNDFARTVGAPARDVATTARLAVDGSDVRVDVGRVEDSYFLNICGFGFDAAVLEGIERNPLPLGAAVYPIAALRQLVGYRGIDIRVGTGDIWREETRHLMLVIANARHFGGAFCIAPDASLTDGRLDAVSIRDASGLRRVRLFLATIRGRHVAEPEVAVEQVPSLRLRFRSPPACDIDGEYRRAASAELEVTCVPQALRLVTDGAGAGAR